MQAGQEYSAGNTRRFGWAILGFLLASFHCGASVFYEFDIVAQTDGATLYHISREVSVNDKGRVAFIGYTNTSTTSFNSIWIGDGYGTPPRPVSSFSSSFRDFKFPQINNVNLVVAYDRVSGAPPTYRVRTWNSDAMDSFTTIGFAGDNDSLTFPSISNDGFVSYVEVGTLGDEVKLFTGATTNTIFTSLFSTQPRPMAAAGGLVVLKGTAPNDLILLVDQNGNETVVASSVDFSSLGRMPGISDDGSVIVFYGDLIGEGPGIFASVDDGAAGRQTIRVAGKVAELGYDEFGGPIQLNSFEADSRLGVCRLPLAPAGPENDSIVICFIGTPSGPSIHNPGAGKPLLFSQEKGIWAVRLDVEKDLSVPTNLNYHPRSPLPVVQINDQLPLGTGQPITDLWIHDPIANAAETNGIVRTQRRGDHYVAFWASTSAGEFAVRAAHFDSDQDGLLDHWERDGIDIDQDGTNDLDLAFMGARPGMRDLFVQIDWSPNQRDHIHLPEFDVVEYVFNVFNEAPALAGPAHGLRTDLDPIEPIPPGIFAHVDAGTNFSVNVGPPFNQHGGRVIGMPGAPTGDLQMAYFAMPGTVAIPYLNARSMHDIKNDHFNREDSGARQLAFHYIFMADYCGLFPQDENPFQGSVTNSGFAFLDSQTPLLDGHGAKLKLEGHFLLIFGGPGQGQARKIYTNSVSRIQVATDWDPGQRPTNGSQFVLIRGNGGMGYQPGDDVIISLRGYALGQFTQYSAGYYDQWRAIVHELGHNLGLRHCGTNNEASVCVTNLNGYRSLMNYGHSHTRPGRYHELGIPAVNSYAGETDATFDDWSNLKMDFQNYFYTLGNAFGMLAGNIRMPPSDEMTVADVERANGGPLDSSPPMISILSPITGGLVTSNAALSVVLNATDNIGIQQVNVAFDVNGNGNTSDSGEIVPATPVGTNQFTALFSSVTGSNATRSVIATAFDTSMLRATATSIVVVASAGCNYSITPLNQGFSASGGSGSITLTTSASCPWAAQTFPDWLRVTSPITGAGNTTIQFTVESNKWATARSGRIIIAGQTFSVDQAAGSCSYVLAPEIQSFTQEGGPGSINISAPAGCSWTATTTAPWIVLTSAGYGAGEGQISYSVDYNPWAARSGTVIVENQTFIVNQSGTSSEFRIEDIRRLANGTVQVLYPANAASYYVLYRATNVIQLVGSGFAQTSDSIDLRQGINGAGSLYDTNPAAGAMTAFYRIAEVPMNQPQDSDHDVIDDVYELLHADILDPLNPADGAWDFDGDGLSNLNEYLNGSNPADPPTSVLSVLENDSGFTSMLVLVGLTNAGVQTNVVTFTTADGTARVGDNDYAVTNGTITFLPGETQKGIVISVRGDTQVESNETFYLNLSLSSAQPGVALVFTQVVCTILNDDSAVGTTSGLVSLQATAYAKLATVPSCDFACWTIQDTNSQSMVFTNGLAGPEDRARADARARRVNPYASSIAEASPGRLSVQTWANVPFPQTDGAGWYVVTNLAAYSVAMKPVTASLPSGSNCTLSVRLHIFGQMGWLLSNIQGTGAVLSARCQFAVNGQVLDSRQYQDRRLLDGNTNLSSFPGTNGDTIEIRIPIKNGQLFTNRVTLESRLVATYRDVFGVGNILSTGPGGFLGLADFSPGVYWDGAVLYDAQDQVIPDFTIESPTLIDWRQSLVPTNSPVQRPVQFGSYNPPKPSSLTIQPPALVLTNPLQNVALQVMASYTNGAVSNVTAAAAWTLYKSYNTSIATVDRNGIVTARGNGKTVVRAENQGATRCILVTVSTNAPILTVAGVIQRRNGQPAVGASVKIAETTQESITGSNGQFEVAGVPGGANTITVMAVWPTNGVRESATSITFSNLSWGTTNIGVIVLNTFFDLRGARMLMTDLEDDKTFIIGGSPVVLPDGLPTGWELLFGYDPTRWDTDGNGIIDPDEDPDGDGVPNGAAGPFPTRQMRSEEENGTDPFSYDSDGDLWDDQIEIQLGSNPHLPNSIPNRFIVASPPVRAIVTGLPAGSTVPPSPSVMFILAQPPVSAQVFGIPRGLESPPPISEQFILAQPPITIRTNSP
jgi:hypothetical protein